ncbi:hypothetical protein PIB30_064790 [Stylosanthes scabra]|uniref:Uncharacterized protein n=1 Tax=Stylosanthes scabra TaxID=79078 RepID=A0ABU6UQJ4_9FABA|nr:hypothetical protein [Stylosanthes scabra]
MAENLDDGEFWLPPQFLTNDDTPLNDFGYNNLTSLLNRQNDVVSRQMLSYGSSYPYSPVEESSETESSDEEEQYHHQIAELTRRVAHTTLGHDLHHHHHHHHSFPSQKPKSMIVSGSPQSTLCGCGGRGGSSSSPNSGCHVTSKRATWDLLRAAAGEVERMRRVHHSNDNFNTERRRFDHHNASVVVPPSNPGIAAFNNNNHRQHLSVTQQKLQIAQFEMLKQQQMAKQQGSVSVWCGAQNRGRSDAAGSVGVRNVGGLCDAAAWPCLQAQQHVKQQNQQQYGSGMRAVFLGNTKRESTGTGVFLPRRVDRTAESKNESRKKSGCSTVLVPARVVQALNLKLEEMVPVTSHHHSRSTVTSNMENADGSTIPRIRSNYNYGFSQQKRDNPRPQPQVNHEIRLPQEWTY